MNQNTKMKVVILVNKNLNARGITKRVLWIAKKEFAFKLFFSFLIRACVMIIPILFAMSVDSISKSDFDKAYLLMAGLIFVAIVHRVSEALNTHAWHKQYNKMYKVFHDYELERTYNNSIFSLSRVSIGEYMNIMNNDINVLCEFYCNISTRIMRAIEFIIIFVYFFMINIYIGFAGVAVSLIAFIVILLSSKKIEKLNTTRALNLDKKSGVLHEMLLCIKEIKSFNIFSSMRLRSEVATDNYVTSYLKQRSIEDFYKFGIILLIELFKLGLFVYGIYLISIGNMELGVLIVIYNYYGQLVDNFSDFATININFRNLKVSESRINKIIEFSKENINKKESVLDNFDGKIIFENILYGYKDSPVLDKVSFEINSNEITCISGRAGSGKTGIIDLLLRLNRQHEGDIFISGVDINNYNNDEYYDLVSSVNTEPVFFNISIRENLSVIDDDFKKIVNICKDLGVHEYITKLKNGYNTVLTSTGDNINPSVRTMLSIARVLLNEPRIVLFDDAFGSLDNNAKNLVMRILIKMRKDHTIIIATNDKEILSNSSKVIFLESGNIEAIGKSNELLKNNDKYRDLIN